MYKSLINQAVQIRKYLAAVVFLTSFFSTDLFAQSGLNYSPEEVSIWQGRTTNGPYKSFGDDGQTTSPNPYSPEDWTRIVRNKDKFMNHADIGKVQVTNITNTTTTGPAIVTVASTATLKTGNSITFSGLSGNQTVSGKPLNGEVFTITVINATSFSLNRTVTGTTRASAGYVQWADHFTPYYPNGATNDGDAPNPHPNHIVMRDAAFYYLLTGETAVASKVVKQLLLQAQEPSVDYSNRTIYPLAGSQDNGPAFVTSEWLTRLLVTYQYVKPTITNQSDKDLVEHWFEESAIWIKSNYDNYLDTRFVDRPAGNYTLTSSALSGQNNAGIVMYFGGPAARHIAKAYNNRRLSMASYIGLWGVYQAHYSSSSSFTNNSSFYISSGKQYMKEWLRFGVFPSGAPSELYRSADYPNPFVGPAYAWSMVAAYAVLADALARQGDDELYTYSTSEGTSGWGADDTKYTGQAGGAPKTFKRVVQWLQKLQNGTLNLYAYSSTNSSANGDPAYLMDGHPSLTDLTKKYVFDTWSALPNLYWKDNTIKINYLRQASGTVPYPRYPQGAGDMPPWGGKGAVIPGVLFMYGQMEGVVWPFKNLSLTANAGADKVISLPTNSTVLNGSGSNGNGTIASYNWTKQSGPATTMSGETTANLTVSNLTTGIYTFRLTVTDNNGATAFDEVTVTVNSNSNTTTFYEAEDTYTSVVEGSGTNGTVGASTCANTSAGRYTRLFDPGDKFTINFNIPQTGTYKLYVRVRSGDSNGQNWYWPNGYGFTVDGAAQTFTGDETSFSAYDCGMWFGTMSSAELALTAGQHAITIQANRNWCAVDYLEVRSVSSFYEAEDTYTSVEEGAGTNGTVGSSSCAITSAGRYTRLFDTGDKFTINFNIAQTGTYKLYVRVRSGDGSSGERKAVFWPSGYGFTVDGATQTFTGDETSFSAYDCGMWFGTMSSAQLALTAGQHAITIQANRNWCAVDYLEVVQITSATRLAKNEKTETSSVTLFPNPFEDRITLDLGEARQGSHVITVADGLGRVHYVQQHTLTAGQRQVEVDLSAKGLKPGVYFLKVGAGTTSKVIKLLKQ